MKNNFCILIDDSNDWIRPFAIKYLKSINLDPKLKILNNPNQIKEFETCFVLGYTKILSKEELQNHVNTSWCMKVHYQMVEGLLRYSGKL